MTVLKCKMCGGELAFEEGATVCECEYCGSKQTIPNVDDEKKMNLFNRANRLRLANEFDKAAGVFESIVAEFPEEAEAYWGLCLCKYGIEYVDDPATAKKVPTCHRTSYDGIFEDENFQMALEYADSVAHRVYREEAKEIDRLQKAILEVASKEEPFDVFICYKETGEDGQRTKDSVLAQDMYDALTGKGYKVFFSRITLEDKLGMEYEPYIFAALNSAKVMLALGTKYEYFNAIWVKNEWARFLELVKKDKSKVLIPCYCDIDAYDMPPEFKNLQGQDMGKIGFMQDLVRGVEKIIPLSKVQSAEDVYSIAVVNAATVDSLLKRAFLFLEDGDWDSAEEYCEKALDINPECAEAYLGKLMANLHVKRQEALKELKKSFYSNENYQKALRFADNNLKEILTGYVEHIKDIRNKEMVYNRAKYAISVANTETAYKEAAHLFETISGYKDATNLVQDCYRKAAEEACRAEEEARKMKEAALQSKEEARIAAEEAEKCQELFKTYKTAIKNEKNWTEQEKLVKGQLLDLTVGRKKLVQLSNEWEHIESSLTILNGKIETANDEIVNLNSELSGTGFFNGKRKRELSEKISLIEGEKQSLERQVTELISKKEGFCSLVAISNKLSEIEQQISRHNKRIEEIHSSRPSKTIRDELERYAFGKTLLSDYDNLGRITTGDLYIFGFYGEEEIEWLVLDRQDNQILVISNYGLDCKAYHEEAVDITWENCSLRHWLNTDFIKEAFSEEEIAMIQTVNVPADKNPKFDTNPGKETNDKVFLLSIDETRKYFSSEEDRVCKPTYYAVIKGAYVNRTGGNCIWWLRTPGNSQDNASDVYNDGDVIERGNTVNVDNNAVRPAMWIDLEQ